MNQKGKVSGGHKDLSFSHGNNFIKIIKPNKDSEVEGYELLTGDKVPSQYIDAPYNKETLSECLKQDNYNIDNRLSYISMNSNSLGKESILQVQKCFTFSDGTQAVVLPKNDVLLDIKVGLKSDGRNSWWKKILNNLYSSQNSRQGFFVDSVKQDANCVKYKKYQQANINKTQKIIDQTLKRNATDEDYQRLGSSIEAIYNLCKEKSCIFHGASIFLINNNGKIDILLADLSHPEKVKEEEFQDTTFARGLMNLRSHISQKVQNKNSDIEENSSENHDTLNAYDVLPNQAQSYEEEEKVSFPPEGRHTSIQRMPYSKTKDRSNTLFSTHTRTSSLYHKSSTKQKKQGGKFFSSSSKGLDKSLNM